MSHSHLCHFHVLKSVGDGVPFSGFLGRGPSTALSLTALDAVAPEWCYQVVMVLGMSSQSKHFEHSKFVAQRAPS